ncbi:hypothetical protein C6P41_001709 [Kluyveromyces marxianus]|nr:hypothetical protein C6P41_001709 [Kluyveromyces marxianus]
MRFCSKRVGFRRYHLKISDEVKDALHNKRPIVSLESTIISHGLPYPQNIEMALAVECEIRRNGAVPATIAFIKGVPKVGLDATEIEQLAEYAQKGAINKVSRRDIAYTMANKLYGGTTISSTMILSEKAGISVFATGGLGGVHKGGELTLDVSADLEELGRTPVAVVCAGPKAILDIPRTMEYLETKGCMVATMGPKGTNVPGFYTRDSGVKSPYNFQSYAEAAQIIHSGNSFGLRSGYLLCCPPPKEVALDEHIINGIIEEACREAEYRGVAGKELTPFLLKEIALKTGGASVSCNISFVLNNASIASKIALELSRLQNTGQAAIDNEPLHLKSSQNDLASNKEEINKKTYSAVIGSVALDTQCKLNSAKVYKFDSNPGKASNSIGGVGHNVALSANLSNRSSNHETVLISSVGDDYAAKDILSDFGMSKEGIYVDKTQSTAQYISLLTQDGELFIAGSDMDIATKIPLDHIKEKIKSLNPNVVLVDANISVPVLQYIVTLRKELGFKLIFEPTSSAKASKIANIKNLGVYPNHDFDIISPTENELKAIHQAMDNAGKFDLDNWFPVLDSLKIDKNISIKNRASNKHLKYLLDVGIFQTASLLLPYFPRIIVKNGARGVYIFSIEKVNSPSKLQLLSQNSDFCMFAKGDVINGDQYGVLVENHAVPVRVDVSNVSGAGDTLVGVLLNELSINPSCLDIDDISRRKNCLDRAQLGAKLSIEDTETISKKLRHLP